MDERMISPSKTGVYSSQKTSLNKIPSKKTTTPIATTKTSIVKKSGGLTLDTVTYSRSVPTDSTKGTNAIAAKSKSPTSVLKNVKIIQLYF